VDHWRTMSNNTIRLRVSQYDAKKNKIILEEPKDMMLVAAVKDCYTCITNWTLQRWASLIFALLLFYAFMTAWMVAHVVGLHATLPDTNSWQHNGLVLGEPRNEDFSVDAIHPANKLVRNQIKELKGSAGTTYSWEGEILDGTPWMEPNVDYYSKASWGETGTNEQHFESDNKVNKLKTRAHWKNYKEPESSFTNKVFKFKRALERKNTICWTDDDATKALELDLVKELKEDYTNECRRADMKDLLESTSNPLYTSAKGFATDPKKTCTANQQVRIANSWRTRELKKAVSIECFLMDKEKLPSPNTAGYRYNTNGKVVHAEKFNQQTLAFAKITLGNKNAVDEKTNACTDPFKSGRAEPWDTTCVGVTYEDETEIGWDTQKQFEAKQKKDDKKYKSDYRKAQGKCEENPEEGGLTCDSDPSVSCCKNSDDSGEGNKKLRITYQKDSFAPHIAEFDVSVTPRLYKDGVECGEDTDGCTSMAEFFPNMLEVWVMCKVVDDNANPDRSPYRFINNDQPKFWEVPGIHKFQFRFGFDFNKHLDSSQRTSKDDEDPNYPTPTLYTAGKGDKANEFGLNNGGVYVGGLYAPGEDADSEGTKDFKERKEDAEEQMKDDMKDAGITGTDVYVQSDC